MALGRGALNVVYEKMGKLKYVGAKIKRALAGSEYGDRMNAAMSQEMKDRVKKYQLFK